MGLINTSLANVSVRTMARHGPRPDRAGQSPVEPQSGPDRLAKEALQLGRGWVSGQSAQSTMSSAFVPQIKLSSQDKTRRRAPIVSAAQPICQVSVSAPAPFPTHTRLALPWDDLLLLPSTPEGLEPKQFF